MVEQWKKEARGRLVLQSSMFESRFYERIIDHELANNRRQPIYELTVPTNIQQHLLAARARKEDRYSSLQYDLQLSGLTVNFVPNEIGCLRHFLSETIAQVATACEVPKKTVRSLFEQCDILNIM